MPTFSPVWSVHLLYSSAPVTLIIIAQENIREKNTDVRRDGEGYFFPEFVGQQDKHEKYETQCIMRLLKGKKKNYHKWNFISAIRNYSDE